MAGLSARLWGQWFRRRSWHIEAIVDAADEVPAKLPGKRVVLVGSFEHPKWLSFDCPCRGGHRIMVNLDPAISPHWILVDVESLTVRPSFNYVHHKGKRRCHFILDRGQILWVRSKRLRIEESVGE
jgi:hypothetical protein